MMAKAQSHERGSPVYEAAWRTLSKYEDCIKWKQTFYTIIFVAAPRAHHSKQTLFKRGRLAIILTLMHGLRVYH